MRYLSLESLGYLAASEFSHEAVKKHQEVVLKALQVVWGGREGGSNAMLVCRVEACPWVYEIIVVLTKLVVVCRQTWALY